MAITALMYGNALQGIFNKEINWANDTIRVMLTTSAYTPNQGTDRYKTSVTNEVVGTGYTAGGMVLASKTVNFNAGTKTLTLSAANVTWPVSTFTTRYAVVYDDTGTAASSALIGYLDFGADQTVSGTDFSIVWSASGIVTGTVA